MQDSLSPNKHAVLSPSSAEKWVNCPGSVAMEADIPNPSSEYSDEGTAAHHLASHCLLLKMEPVQYLGRTIKFWKDGTVSWFNPRILDKDGYPEEDKTLVRREVRVGQDMVDNINQYILEANTALGAEGEMLIEVQLPIGHITGEVEAFGTSDLVFLKPRELHVRDLKYGKGVQVFAERNLQLLLYALGAYDKYKDHEMYLLEDLETITIAIHQPRLGHHDEWTIPLKELLDYRKMFEEAGKKSFDILNDPITSELILKPGHHCEKGFCRARAKCPALKKYVIDSCSFENIDDGLKDLDLTADQLGDSMSRLDIIKSWIKKVEEEAYRRLDRGDKVTGYKLVMGREGNREWADEDKTIRHLFTLGFTKDQMYDKKLKSPSKMKEDLSLSKQRFAELNSLIHRANPKPTVAKESSTKAAISNADGFENLE